MLFEVDPKYQAGNPPTPAEQPAGMIVSPDTHRENRIPPGQSRTRKWPVLQYGRIPVLRPQDWSLSIEGEVERPERFTWEQFQALPRVKVFADFHCVTRWSRLGNVWEGVSVATLMERVGVRPAARYVVAGGFDDGWTTNMPLADFRESDVLVADLHDGAPLTADHGGPVRLIVPRLYAWKSAKWLSRLVFLKDDEPGLWEQNGYHNHGDPWVINRNNPDGERFRDDPAWTQGR